MSTEESQKLVSHDDHPKETKEGDIEHGKVVDDDVSTPDVSDPELGEETTDNDIKHHVDTWRYRNCLHRIVTGGIWIFAIFYVFTAFTTFMITIGVDSVIPAWNTLTVFIVSVTAAMVSCYLFTKRFSHSYEELVNVRKWIIIQFVLEVLSSAISSCYFVSVDDHTITWSWESCLAIVIVRSIFYGCILGYFSWYLCYIQENEAHLTNYVRYLPKPSPFFIYRKPAGGERAHFRFYLVSPPKTMTRLTKHVPFAPGHHKNKKRRQ